MLVVVTQSLEVVPRPELLVLRPVNATDEILVRHNIVSLLHVVPQLLEGVQDDTCHHVEEQHSQDHVEREIVQHAPLTRANRVDVQGLAHVALPDSNVHGQPPAFPQGGAAPKFLIHLQARKLLLPEDPVRDARINGDDHHEQKKGLPKLVGRLDHRPQYALKSSAHCHHVKQGQAGNHWVRPTDENDNGQQDVVPQLSVHYDVVEGAEVARQPAPRYDEKFPNHRR
mmetsp:Transcript_21484/g.40403  ORF Transcript_21484/g.40403 Transcript_21484/m.40403 type:complete len:227 (-) Transcript_21484:4480-5160(-)